MVPIEQKDWTEEDRASKLGQNHPLDSKKTFATISANSGLSSHVSMGWSTPRRRQLRCFATSKAPFASALA